MFYARKLPISLTLGHFATRTFVKRRTSSFETRIGLAPAPAQTTESKETEIVP